MKGDIIPDDDHVSRLCGGSHIREDGTISATAFKPRSGESYLSVNWLEHLQLPNRLAQIDEVWRVLATKRTVGRTARLAVLSVGTTKASVSARATVPVELLFIHEPEVAPDRPADASHSGIHGVPPDD